MERLVGGVVEGDAVAEPAVRRPQSGAAHRREVGQRGAHEELGGDGVVADPEPGGDMTHEVHRHILPGGGADPARE